MTALLSITAGLIALIALLIIYMRREASCAVLETIRLTTEEEGLRVVHLSDLHLKIGGVRLSAITSAVRDAAPQIVVLTGDYIDSSKESDRFISWMGDLIGAVSDAAFYMCFGNHDRKAFTRSPSLMRELTKSMKRLGVYVVENRTLSFYHDDKLYAITGFSDYYASPFHNPQKAFKGTPKDARYHIGLSHNPDIALELNGPRPNLLLLGHFHGGQIWLPFHLEYACLRKERLCKIGIRRGLHFYGGRFIYISRGLGCVLFPLRLGSRPEITLFILP